MPEKQFVLATVKNSIYASSDEGKTWSLIIEDLKENLKITLLNANNRYLFAGTAQNGIWHRSLAEIIQILKTKKQ